MASHLGLCCLPMSHRKDARLIRVKKLACIFVEGYIAAVGGKNKTKKKVRKMSNFTFEIMSLCVNSLLLLITSKHNTSDCIQNAAFDCFTAY